MEEDPLHIERIEGWYELNRTMDLRYSFDLNEKSVVLDLGAYEGAWAKEINRRYGCIVHSYEPVNSAYQKAKINLAGIDNIYLHNYGLRSFNGICKIFVNNDGSSFYNESGTIEEVEVKSVIEEISSLNLTNIDLIKLNIENDEYEVLDAIIDNNILSMINYFQIQFHREVPNYKERRDRIHKYLLLNHKQDYNFDFVWEGWSRCI